jgi:hypothetical protein
MKRLVLAGACATLLASFAADAGTNPSGRATGHDRAITRMSPQGLAHSQGLQRAHRANPATRPERPTPPSGTIPATPATRAVPPTEPGMPATPAKPATPATPGKPPRGE